MSEQTNWLKWNGRLMVIGFVSLLFLSILFSYRSSTPVTLGPQDIAFACPFCGEESADVAMVTTDQRPVCVDCLKGAIRKVHEELARENIEEIIDG